MKMMMPEDRSQLDAIINEAIRKALLPSAKKIKDLEERVRKIEKKEEAKERAARRTALRGGE